MSFGGDYTAMQQRGKAKDLNALVSSASPSIIPYAIGCHDMVIGVIGVTNNNFVYERKETCNIFTLRFYELVVERAMPK